MAIAYVPYLPDPMQGQALLNNFTRTRRVLRYRESGRDVQSVERGMPLYEVELRETVGEPNSGNMLMRGECVSACAHLAKLIRSGEMRPIDLVYIEREYYMLLMGRPEVQTYGLEVYYNGDRSVADFRISCLEERDGSWRNVSRTLAEFFGCR